MNDRDPTDTQAMFLVLLCWLGYLGLGLAYVLRQPGWAMAALVVIVAAYAIESVRERGLLTDWRERMQAIEQPVVRAITRTRLKGEQLRARLAWRKARRA
jgi:hypothetical protein